MQFISPTEVKKINERMVTVTDRALKDSLVRKGFEFTGSVGDGCSCPTKFYLFGDIRRCSIRERAGVNLGGFTKGKFNRKGLN